MGNREVGSAPNVSDAAATEIADRVYGISGTVRRLLGEFDQNFRVQDAQGRQYLLKFTPPHVGADRVEFQNALLKHIAARAPHLHVPRLVMSCAGDPLWVDESHGGSHVRMLVWVDGTAYCDWQPKTAVLRSSLGIFLAELTDTLASFEYRDPPSGHMWDLAYADQHFASSRFIPDAPTRDRAERILRRFAVEIQPALGKLAGSAIHGDINDSNLLLNKDTHGDTAWGLIDFGDAVWSHAVCELAVAATYVCINEERPDLAIADLLDSYAGARSLSATEHSLLMPLVETRLAVSLCVSARRRHDRPGESHLQWSAGPAATTLKRLGRAGGG